MGVFGYNKRAMTCPELNRRKRILLTGGGTGGHIYPLLAVHEALQKEAEIQNEKLEFRYFGPCGAWSDIIRKAGVPVRRIASAKLRRYASLTNIIDAPKFLWSVVQALVKVAVFKPHIAFSKGGVGALPVLLACKLYGVPIVIHESDSVAGIVSRTTGKWARIVELGWDAATSFFPNKKTRTVGIPLREDIVRGIAIPQTEAKRALGLTADLPVIFITGGSQGSERMNELTLKALPQLTERFQILHQTGGRNHAAHMAQFERMKKGIPEHLLGRYHPFSYLDQNLPRAYAAADCVVTRGGSALFEIAVYGKPAIVIPLTGSANGHQEKNAALYADCGAGIVLEDTATPDMLIEKISEVLDGELNPRMAQAARDFAKPEAAYEIARDILKLLTEYAPKA